MEKVGEGIGVWMVLSFLAKIVKKGMFWILYQNLFVEIDNIIYFVRTDSKFYIKNVLAEIDNISKIKLLPECK